LIINNIFTRAQVISHLSKFRQFAYIKTAKRNEQFTLSVANFETELSSSFCLMSSLFKPGGQPRESPLSVPLSHRVSPYDIIIGHTATLSWKGFHSGSCFGHEEGALGG
jgi:hypothetical protein